MLPIASDCVWIDRFRFTSAAAASLAEGAGLSVEESAAEGGYAVVLCDVVGLAMAAEGGGGAAPGAAPAAGAAAGAAPGAAPGMCGVHAPTEGEPLWTAGGFYLATSMVARLKSL